MAAVLLALCSSLIWGVGDFLGGALSRRLPAFAVLLWSQVFGLLLVIVVAAFAWDPPGAYLWWGALGSLAGTSALALFYLALAMGTMSIVAPIAGTGLVVPVVVGLASGERPSVAQLVGIVIAAAGVVLASGPELRGAGGSRRSVVYACLAALGFGTAQACLARGADTSVVMTQLAAFAAGLLVAVVAVLVTRTALRVARTDLPRIGAIGALNLLGLGAFSLATTKGLVSVVAVLASLYPVITVLLARQVYGERLRGVQAAGVLAAFAGVVLLAAG